MFPATNPTSRYPDVARTTPTLRCRTKLALSPKRVNTCRPCRSPRAMYPWPDSPTAFGRRVSMITGRRFSTGGWQHEPESARTGLRPPPSGLPPVADTFQYDCNAGYHPCYECLVRQFGGVHGPPKPGPLGPCRDRPASATNKGSNGMKKAKNDVKEVKMA